MRVKAALKSYEDLIFAIAIDAPVSDWRALLKLLEQLNKSAGNYAYAWPLGGIVGGVRKMLEDLDKTHADAILKEDQAAPTAAQRQLNVADEKLSDNQKGD